MMKRGGGGGQKDICILSQHLVINFTEKYLFV